MQSAYAIGVAEPVSIRVESYGTSKIADEEITAALRKACDMTPAGIINKLNLPQPIYTKIAEFDYFGINEGRPRENTDLAPILKELSDI